MQVAEIIFVTTLAGEQTHSIGTKPSCSIIEVNPTRVCFAVYKDLGMTIKNATYIG